MLALKFLLMILGFALFASAAILVAYDVFAAARLRWLLRQAGSDSATEAITPTAVRPFGPVRWKLASLLALAAIVPVLLSLSLAIVPDGSAGIRVSQFSGVRPATLYPGVHLITPLIDSVVLYDTREQIFSTVASSSPKATAEVLTVQAREGLNIGLSVSVRYRLDPSRLAAIHQNLPQPVGEQVVAPVVSSIYRQLSPNYLTREIFALKREELRVQAADAIKSRLASDGIVVR
jgi:regulator of protease activity HflC (stomatin/prohibitin superfamily)